jgi:hypothetical protein
MLFFPDIDLKISLTLLVVSFAVGLITLAISKKWLLSLTIFSILGNLSLLINLGSFMFDVYGIKWLQYFSLFIWPIINIFLIVLYRRKKKQA